MLLLVIMLIIVLHIIFDRCKTILLMSERKSALQIAEMLEVVCENNFIQFFNNSFV